MALIFVVVADDEAVEDAVLEVGAGAETFRTLTSLASALVTPSFAAGRFLIEEVVEEDAEAEAGLSEEEALVDDDDNVKPRRTAAFSGGTPGSWANGQWAPLVQAESGQGVGGEEAEVRVEKRWDLNMA